MKRLVVNAKIVFHIKLAFLLKYIYFDFWVVDQYNSKVPFILERVHWHHHLSMFYWFVITFKDLCDECDDT